jgi:hypothetical protein
MRDRGRWKDPPDVERGEQEVSHGYCPSCAAKVFAEIRNRHQEDEEPERARVVN